MERKRGLAERFRLAPGRFLYSPPQFGRSCSVVHRFVDDYILERGVDREKGNGQGLSEKLCRSSSPRVWQ